MVAAFSQFENERESPPDLRQHVRGQTNRRQRSNALDIGYGVAVRWLALG